MSLKIVKNYLKKFVLHVKTGDFVIDYKKKKQMSELDCYFLTEWFLFTRFCPFITIDIFF